MLDNASDPDFNALPLTNKVAEILRYAEGCMSLGAFMDRPGIKGFHSALEVREALTDLVDGGFVERTDKPGGRTLYRFVKAPAAAAPPAVAEKAAPTLSNSLKARILGVLPAAPAGLTAREVHERLPGDGFPSIQTTLSVLCAEGAVAHDRTRPARWSRAVQAASKVGKLELKRRTLRRLEELLEPSIASVLAEIRGDLEAA